MPSLTPLADAKASPSIIGRFPIVGVGASAGGLAALRRLLEAVAEHPKFAIVIVHHLARDKPSLAPELLGKYTHMPVRQADDGQLVEHGNVYIIPPGQFLGIDQGKLTLTPIVGPRSAPRRHRLLFSCVSQGSAGMCRWHHSFGDWQRRDPGHQSD